VKLLNLAQADGGNHGVERTARGYLFARPGPPEVISGLLGPHPATALAAPGLRKGG
jgi:hypothetical protein